ncbi:MAG TPA: hypothetical protein VK484_01050 [Ferruginibacter sp.]|nr:hypothetical protein [Ferruginibacter sp.]
MKKALLIFSLFFNFCLFSEAQFKQIAEGPKFTEPEEGYAKILQMKNGSVFYLSIYYKTGIDIRIYDASHAQKVVTHITLSSRITEFHEVESIFEINNDIVLFLSDAEELAPVLYRITIDANTGKLKEEKTICTLKKGGGSYVLSGETRFFSVSKDPYSDNYAIAFYHVKENEREKRIEVVHYGNDHREISRVFCISPDADRSFFLYINMTVINSEKVYAFLFATKEKYFFKKKGNVLMATIEKGSVSYSNVNFPEDLPITGGLSRYNPVTKKIILLTVARENFTEYSIYSTIIDPVTKKMQMISDVGSGEKVNIAYKERFSKKSGYSGMPQNLFINDDGSFSILYEEIQVQTEGGKFGGRTDTKLGKVVVATYDKNGTIASNYLVPKEHWALLERLVPFYHSRKERTAQFLYMGNQYKSFAYLNGVNKNYVLFNDTERNNEVNKDKFVEVQAISECDAFMYELTGNDVFPKREYTLGKSANVKEHNLLMYAVADYDKKNNVYVTLRLDKEEGANKDVKLVGYSHNNFLTSLRTQ